MPQKSGHEGAVFNPGSSGGDCFDSAQDGGAAAEVVHQLDEVAAARLNVVAVRSEACGFGVAEAEDGLIDVADSVEFGQFTEREKQCADTITSEFPLPKRSLGRPT